VKRLHAMLEGEFGPMVMAPADNSKTAAKGAPNNVKDR
jgi:hypothetical protein